MFRRAEKDKSTENRVVVNRAHAPYLSGVPLMVLTVLAEYVPGIARFMLWNAGFGALDRLRYVDEPTTMPLPLPKEYFGIRDDEAPVVGLELFHGGRDHPEHCGTTEILTSSHFHEAYISGKITPVQVCEKLLANIDQSQHSCDPPVNAFVQYDRDDVLAQARASANRYAGGKPIGPLDGVPVAVKDEFDVAGYETRAGTSFIGRGNKCSKDCGPAKRLRDQGAIIIGKTAMHEMGCDTTGNNPNSGTARNPYNHKHYPGGSSTGSACAVASGFCPIAIGADGGGSVRIPSSFCGVYGLKPTCGRVSAVGEFTLSWTNAVCGPLATSADDLALAYYVIAGKDPEDQKTMFQPSPTLHGISMTTMLSDLRIGIYSAWNKQVNNPEIATALHEFIETLKLRGAQIVEIEIPELEEGRMAHALAIYTESVTTARRFEKDAHKFTYQFRSLSAIFGSTKASHYIVAMQVRTRLMRTIAKMFAESVDLVLTPTTAITAPPIPSRALWRGEVNATVTSDAARFVQLANFTGVPAVSVPAGYDENGLPIGLQFIAKWYNEALLLRMTKVAEEILGTGRRKPSDARWFGNLLE